MEKLTGKYSEESIQPFNNSIETGLRVLAIITAGYPKSYDLQTLVYLDYLTVHTGDIDSTMKSLHPAVPSRKGELFIRRAIIDKSLSLFEKKGLIKRIFQDTGIEFEAGENAVPFIESLSEQYFIDLNIRAKWVIDKFTNLNSSELDLLMKKYMVDMSKNFTLNLIHDNE